MTKKVSSRQRTDYPSAGLRGVIGIIFAYAFLSRAFSTGSYWQYLAALLFFVLGVKLLVRSFKNYHGSKNN